MKCIHGTHWLVIQAAALHGMSHTGNRPVPSAWFPCGLQGFPGPRSRLPFGPELHGQLLTQLRGLSPV